MIEGIRAAAGATRAGNSTTFSEEVVLRIRRKREEAMDRRNKFFFQRACEEMDKNPGPPKMKVDSGPERLNFHNCHRLGEVPSTDSRSFSQDLPPLSGGVSPPPNFP